MAKLASIEFHAERDVTRGNKIPVNQLFSTKDQWQEFELLENVENDKTRIKVDIAKVSPFQTKVNTTRKKGEKTGWLLLLKRDDLTRKVAVTGDIKKGDTLAVALEKL